MKLDQTPFCIANGLLDFTKIMTELDKNLSTIHNLNIKAKAEKDKWDFWGDSNKYHNSCYGRHFLIKDKYDFWLGLDITPDKVTIAITFEDENNKPEQSKEITEKLKNIKNEGTYFNMTKEKIWSLNDFYFEKFSENLSIQILVNFVAEVFKELKLILK